MTSFTLFQETFALLRRAPLIFGTLALAGQVIIGLFTFVILGSVTVTEEQMLAPNTGVIFVLFASLILPQVLSAVLHLAAWDVIKGNPLTISTYITTSIILLPQLVLLSIFAGLAVGLGFLLLIVPGFYVLGGVLVLIPTVVIGRAGWRSFGRAWELSAGKRWTLVGAVLLASAVTIAVGLVLGFIGGLFGLTLIAEVLAGALGIMITAALATVAYARLTEDVADVF
ncbi:MAG: hypothetical protein AAFQ36_04590 [Pseudomonadota bacterium]